MMIYICGISNPFTVCVSRPLPPLYVTISPAELVWIVDIDDNDFSNLAPGKSRKEFEKLTVIGIAHSSTLRIWDLTSDNAGLGFTSSQNISSMSGSYETFILNASR